MEYVYIQEMLHLLFLRSGNKPEVFVSFFNTSRSLIAYNYSYNQNRFTHLSDSFRLIMGFKTRKFMINGNFSEQLIHPQDQTVFHSFFSSLPELAKNNVSYKRIPVFTNTKCRARHIKGFWKYLLFFSEEYWDEKDKGFNKIGIIIDEHFNQKYQVVAKNNGHTVINDISRSKSVRAGEYASILNKVSISFRENEILVLIGQGLIAKEIAEKLNISTNTVITHRKNLIKKLNVKNTAELIKKASHLMLI